MRWIADDWLSFFFLFLSRWFRVWLSVEETTERKRERCVRLSERVLTAQSLLPGLGACVLVVCTTLEPRLHSKLMVNCMWTEKIAGAASMCVVSNDPLSSETELRLVETPFPIRHTTDDYFNQLRLGGNSCVGMVFFLFFFVCLISRSKTKLKNPGRYLPLDSGVSMCRNSWRAFFQYPITICLISSTNWMKVTKEKTKRKKAIERHLRGEKKGTSVALYVTYAALLTNELSLREREMYIQMDVFFFFFKKWKEKW